MATRHTRRKYVYHTCAVCGTDEPLSEMVWQNGRLRCTSKNCVDTAIIGDRDIKVATAVSIERHELQADRKLTEPIERRSNDQDVQY